MDTALSPPILVSSEPPTTFEKHLSSNTHEGVPKDWKFWCIIFSLALSLLVTAVESVSHLILCVFFPERRTHAMPGYNPYRMELGQHYRLSSTT
jgi:hypothetical protein